MNPVAVMRAARIVRDELDFMPDDTSGELRDRLDQLLAEEGRQAAGPLAEAVVSLVSRYGPAWERMRLLLGQDEQALLEEPLPEEPAPASTAPQPRVSERGPSVIGRLTGAFRRRRKDGGERPAAPGGREPLILPLVETPGEVVAGWGAEVEVGLIPQETPGGSTAAPAREPVDLDVQIIAEGFEAPAGWRVRLRADEATPYPRAKVGLVALAQEQPVTARQIQVVHAVRGQVTGFGVRALAVLDSPGLLGQENAPHPVAGTPVRLTGLGEAPDVTAVVVHGDRPGRLWWTYHSPHFVTPDQAEACELGMRVSEFGRSVARQDLPLEEAGRQVATRVPPGFWELLNAVAGRVAPRRPSVLILSQEPHVPWELASLERPIDRSVPGFLNCQTVTGRWPLGGRRPELPPPVRTGGGGGMAVVYGGPQAHPLVPAFGARQVSPALGDVMALLGDPPDVVHFATGAPAPESLGRGMGGGSFVFLDEPGDCQPFLLAGASGAVAPFRPVGDGLVEEFYRRSLGGEPPAEVLRSLRCMAPATAPAYRFFGHPSLTLSRDHSAA
ncbi:hypothetical protein [Streptosporangium carneum]|uniref:Uncharacterized protein n=1 Tax=Streptosporangium carneum TaxID=47481 RepID=A0A9W6HYI2_9ACTN|nr:hypothetical protein [Streptosporangium carneum]GLK08671.1 hypothetical protein GCM10017600_20760 [Streptosporangium carneum]